MILALIQTNPIIGDITGNKEKILAGYNKASSEGVDLVVFSELSLLGYAPLDLIEKKEFRAKADQAVKELACATRETGLIFGSIHEIDDVVGTNLYNSAYLCCNGEIIFIQHKTLIPNYDVFDEMRYFESSPSVSNFLFKGEVIGISICEDIWNDEDYWKKRLYSNDPVAQQIKEGAEILINISASPYSYGKRIARYLMLHTLARHNNVSLAYVCCAGAQTEIIFDGGTMCLNNKGELAVLGKSFEEDYLIFDTKKQYDPIVKIEGSFEEEVYNALVCGIRDYCSKTQFKQVLIGLSGGIDSALVTCLAVEAVGAENVNVVLMPSRYSSQGSINDSLNLITNLGIKHKIISIEPAFETLTTVLSPHFEGKEADITEENLQSRIRGVYLMALSNKFNYLLLTTGNKSEMAVGYCTLYGDMCGGLGVIADVYKTGVYKISNYINRNKEIIPKEIIEKAPSAELRPNQTDQDTLPPYDFLDKILKMYLEENKEYNEISSILGDSEKVLRVLNLVDLNEFKRKQAAPALRVSNKAFGYGRRVPIVQKWRKVYEQKS